MSESASHKLSVHNYIHYKQIKINALNFYLILILWWACISYHTNEDVFDRLMKSSVDIYFIDINYQN